LSKLKISKFKDEINKEKISGLGRDYSQRDFLTEIKSYLLFEKMEKIK
jgi:hypothetical protein